MTPADRIAAEANARVNGWPTLSHAERQSLLSELPAYVKELRSGGAILSLNGVDRWLPSRRHAEAELSAFTES
jgi:hypothetical protein